MACAAAHDEQVKDLVQSKVFPVVFKPGELQRVDDAAHGVDDATGKKEAEAQGRQLVEQRSNGYDTKPAHGDVHNG